jgi:hypothetical protein
MARDLGAALISEVQAGTVRPVLLFEGVFATGTLNAWTGVGTLSWDSKSWVGTGAFGSVSAIEETDQVVASGIQVALNGIASTNVSLALQSCRQGAAGKVWLALLDSAGAIVGTPYLAFSGRLDVPVIDEGGDSATITIAYESRLADLERPRIRRYTDEDQRAEYPGDLGFQYVAGLQDKPIPWGQGVE